MAQIRCAKNMPPPNIVFESAASQTASLNARRSKYGLR